MKRVIQHLPYLEECYNDNQLIKAVFGGDIVLAKDMLKQGANIDCDLPVGHTLSICILTKNDAMLDLLLRYKPTIDFISKNNKSRTTPWMQAVEQGYEYGYQKLQEAGANIHALDSEGRNAYYLAISNGNNALPVIEYLISQKVDPWIRIDEKEGTGNIYRSACLFYHMCENLPRQYGVEFAHKHRGRVSEKGFDLYVSNRFLKIPSLDDRIAAITRLSSPGNSALYYFLSFQSEFNWNNKLQDLIKIKNTHAPGGPALILSSTPQNSAPDSQIAVNMDAGFSSPQANMKAHY